MSSTSTSLLKVEKFIFSGSFLKFFKRLVVYFAFLNAVTFWAVPCPNSFKPSDAIFEFTIGKEFPFLSNFI